MTRRTVALTLALIALAAACAAQSLSVQWEELTAPDFVKAIGQARGVCLLPMGVIEKHGPAGPLGTAVLNVHFATVAAAKQEYSIVFPGYYVGQIFEARPELVHPGRAASQSGANLRRLVELPPSVYTGIWWHVQFPNHYEGDASGANAARGQAAVKARAGSIAAAVKAIQADSVAPKLQPEFFDAARHPLDTKQ